MTLQPKPLHIHILGICGTFMGGLALIARELGYTVSGSDQNVYPPMSTQLEQQGIRLMNGYKAENLDSKPDIVVIGNAMSRGNPEVEAVLNRGLRYTSGPQWLAEHVLQDRWVLAVAGTHGKTTTTGMLSWILDYNGFKPGFLIGGIPLNFGISARLGESDFFVIEADEYDCAFFDKRSKFVHYRPRTAILNNLEYDHADIFENLDAIKKTIPPFAPHRAGRRLDRRPGRRTACQRSHRHGLLDAGRDNRYRRCRRLASTVVESRWQPIRRRFSRARPRHRGLDTNRPPQRF